MGKLKINLVSGVSSEKPLISAFTENNNSYVVLDNEMNGSMGLPIILVSKLEENKLVKIIDQNEWQVVKEYLKNIIAGNKVEFIKLNNEIQADDVYYTQLTLPVPSFDALKNAYTFKDGGNDGVVSPIANALNNVGNEEVVNIDATSAPIQPEPPFVAEAPSIDINIQSSENTGVSEITTPIIPEIPVVESQPVETTLQQAPVTNPVLENSSEPIVNINTPLVDINIPSMTESENAQQSETINQPSIDISPISEESPINLDNPLANNLNTPVLENTSEVSKEPEITPTPVIDASIVSTPVVQESVFKEQKEAFMQACENMFDALVQKFEKELENRK